MLRGQEHYRHPDRDCGAHAARGVNAHAVHYEVNPDAYSGRDDSPNDAEHLALDADDHNVARERSYERRGGKYGFVDDKGRAGEPVVWRREEAFGEHTSRDRKQLLVVKANVEQAVAEREFLDSEGLLVGCAGGRSHDSNQPSNRIHCERFPEEEDASRLQHPARLQQCSLQLKVVEDSTAEHDIKEPVRKREGVSVHKMEDRLVESANGGFSSMLHLFFGDVDRVQLARFQPSRLKPVLPMEAAEFEEATASERSEVVPDESERLPLVVDLSVREGGSVPLAVHPDFVVSGFALPLDSIFKTGWHLA